MLLLRVVLSLAIVLVVLGIAYKVASKRTSGSRTGALEVLARQPLTRTTAVSVVRVGDRAFVLGSGESQVTLIGETDLDSLTDYLPTAGSDGAPAVGSAVSSVSGTGPLAGSVFDPAGWRAVLTVLRERTVRRS